MAEARERFMAEVDSAVHPTPGLFALLEHLERRDLPGRSRPRRAGPTPSDC